MRVSITISSIHNVKSLMANYCGFHSNYYLISAAEKAPKWSSHYMVVVSNILLHQKLRVYHTGTHIKWLGAIGHKVLV